MEVIDFRFKSTRKFLREILMRAPFPIAFKKWQSLKSIAKNRNGEELSLSQKSMLPIVLNKTPHKINIDVSIKSSLFVFLNLEDFIL